MDAPPQRRASVGAGLSSPRAPRAALVLLFATTACGASGSAGGAPAPGTPSAPEGESPAPGASLPPEDPREPEDGELLPEEVDPEYPREPPGTAPSEERLFRVWAPFATSVHVAGSFNDWSRRRHPLTRGEGGVWTGAIDEARPGDEYRIVLETPGDGGRERLWRQDSRSREVRHSTGNSVLREGLFGGDAVTSDFRTPSREEAVIYELHVGTFRDDRGGGPGTFESARSKLDDLADLGVNVIELMPVAEFAGDFSWGYNPAHPFAVETAYGGPEALKRFIASAHRRGMAVIIDVVYNHFGPEDLSLWRFDGWSSNDRGGIYFYNDHRASTPWGDTRPDYGRSEVRKYIYDNARMWLEEYGADGLRWDSTINIRSHDGGREEIADGWALLQRANRMLHARFPRSLSIAEDLQGNDWITRSAERGGAGFDTQWDPSFVHPVRQALITSSDRDRNIGALGEAVRARIGEDPFDRVIYTESHDEVANGNLRLPEAIWPGNAGSWPARKRSALGAVLVLTSPGVPMLFQGQELLEDGDFRDTDPLDWTRYGRFFGIRTLYRDLIRLRRNLDGVSRGLLGPNVNVFHANEDAKVLAFHRWDGGGPGDDVVVVVNFSSDKFGRYELGFPRPGRWRLRFDGDAPRYGQDLGALLGTDVEASNTDRDGLPASGTLRLGPYTAQIYSQGD